MMWTPILALALVVPASGEGDAAERMKAICDTLASAPSVTFDVKLLPLVDEQNRKRPDGGTVQIGKSAREQTLVIRYEIGRPEHLALDDAEIFRFEGGLLVGRLAGGEWARVPDAAEKERWPRPFKLDDGSTALDRLAAAARGVSAPVALLKRVRGEIAQAEEETSSGAVVLVAGLNGHDGTERGPIDVQTPGRTVVEETTRINARLRPDGTAESLVVGRQVRRWIDGKEFMGFLSETLRPSAIGATSVVAPPEVTALAAR